MTRELFCEKHVQQKLSFTNAKLFIVPHLILTSAWFGFVEQSTLNDNYFLKEFSCRQVTPCQHMSALAQ